MSNVLDELAAAMNQSGDELIAADNAVLEAAAAVRQAEEVRTRAAEKYRQSQAAFLDAAQSGDVIQRGRLASALRRAH